MTVASRRFSSAGLVGGCPSAGCGRAGGRSTKGPEELREAMTELNVSLDFACCQCHGTVAVKVCCTGKGLAGGPRGAARVNVPCPNCGEVVQVIFETCGLVRSVEPYLCRTAPAPSVN